MRRTPLKALCRLNRRIPLLYYLGIITLMTFIFTGSLLAKAYTMGYQDWLIALISLPLLLGASHLAVALVNWLATLLATPRLLPRMDFSGGIPPESRTLAVIPTMLTSAKNIEDLVEALEVRFLANRDKHLHFGLLTDFRDASEETLPEDEPLLRLAQKRIQGLNEKYRDPKADTFFLFHRPHRWNPQEQIWMCPGRGPLGPLDVPRRGGDGPERREERGRCA